jgi:hypothetical protein
MHYHYTTSEQGPLMMMTLLVQSSSQVNQTPLLSEVTLRLLLDPFDTLDSLALAKSQMLNRNSCAELQYYGCL